MCGRVLSISPHELLRELGVIEPELPKRYNLAPTDPIPLVRQWGTFERMRWGLTMSNPKADGINAKVESLGWLMYRENLQKRRCLIVTDGFFEWRAVNGKKFPYLISRADRSPMIMAGIYDSTGGAAIITRPSQGVVAELHDRMPVVLERSVWKHWVDPNVKDVQPMLEAANGNGLVTHPVSRAVNNVRNDDARLIEEVPEFTDDAPPPQVGKLKKQLGLF